MFAFATTSLQAICNKEARAREAARAAGITVHTPLNALGNRVTYQSGLNKLSFKQDRGQWVEGESAAGRFGSEDMAFIATHLAFYKQLVEA